MAEHPNAAASRPIRARALILGVALIWLSAHWVFWGEIVRYSFVTLAAPFCHAVYLLLLVSLGNLWLRARRPQAALTGLETLAVYAMVSVGSAMLSCDLQSILVTELGYPAYFADKANRWSTLFDGAMPPWLLVGPKEAVSGFFRGNSSFWKPEVMRAWAFPVLVWTLVLWAAMLAMLCASALLRRAWAENERLTFPIVALPLAMAQHPRALYSSRVFWIGFAVAAAVTLLNGLNTLYPAIPAIPIKRQYILLIPSGPMQPVATITVAFYFFAVTLGFLMPLDLSASLSLFYLLYRAELLVVANMGLPPESRAPYADSQAFGAYMWVFAAAAWRLRAQLAAVWRSAAGGGAEARSTRAAAAGLVVSVCLLFGFLVAAGMKPWVAALFLTLFGALSVLITRIRAEFGFPVHDMHQMGPVNALVRNLGAETFDKPTLGMFALLHWTSRAYRGHPMPHALEALKVAGHAEADRRAMAFAVGLAGLVAVPICWAVFLHGFYRVGAATASVNMWGVGYAREAFSVNLSTWLNSPAPPMPGDRMAMLAGCAVAATLGALRQCLPGLPLHPLAYAAANSWGMANLWLPILIGCLSKGAVLKWRGLSGYRAATLFFFGLMLGEFAVGCSWTLLGMVLNVQTYEFWP